MWPDAVYISCAQDKRTAWLQQAKDTALQFHVVLAAAHAGLDAHIHMAHPEHAVYV